MLVIAFICVQLEAIQPRRKERRAAGYVLRVFVYMCAFVPVCYVVLDLRGIYVRMCICVCVCTVCVRCYIYCTARLHIFYMQAPESAY